MALSRTFYRGLEATARQENAGLQEILDELTTYSMAPTARRWRTLSLSSTEVLVGSGWGDDEEQVMFKGAPEELEPVRQETIRLFGQPPSSTAPPVSNAS